MEDAPLKITSPLFPSNVPLFIKSLVSVNVFPVNGAWNVPLLTNDPMEILFAPDVHVPELIARAPTPVIAFERVTVPVELLVTLFNEPRVSAPVARLMVVGIVPSL